MDEGGSVEPPSFYFTISNDSPNFRFIRTHSKQHTPPSFNHRIFSLKVNLSHAIHLIIFFTTTPPLFQLLFDYCNGFPIIRQLLFIYLFLTLLFPSFPFMCIGRHYRPHPSKPPSIYDTTIFQACQYAWCHSKEPTT